MTHRDTAHCPESDDSMALSRRGFLQGSVAAAAAGVFGLPNGGVAMDAQPNPRGGPSGRFHGKRPNFLIFMCDEMRFPPIYESDATKKFRRQYLKTQNLLRRNGLDFHRHYAASCACTGSRASLYTGHYPSLHGATQTPGGAKAPFDPDAFWLDPNRVPTFGDYFRLAGYRTFWRGKWHASDADMLIPGTHNQLLSYDSTTGAPDPTKQALYTASDRLDRYGFSGWIGPEPHGSEPLNSGSSVPPDQQGRDVGFAQQTRNLIRQLDHDHSSAPWIIVSSFVNPHDISLWGLWANMGFGPEFEFHIEEGVVPEVVFDQDLFDRTKNDDLLTKPKAQLSYKTSYDRWMQPILNDPLTLNKYYRYYYQLHKNVDEQMLTVFQTFLHSRYKDDTIVIFTSDHGDLLGSHNGLHQKFYQAYEETTRVPLIIWNKTLFPKPRTVDTLTSHIDLVPTLLGLAGIDPEPIRKKLAQDHSDARPFVGRDLSSLILGEIDPAKVNDPLYFMTEDDPSRGLNENNWYGVPVNSVIQPNHIETVIARLEDGNVWKYTRYFDNPQFWSIPGAPVPHHPNPKVEDVVVEQKDPTPIIEGIYNDLKFVVTVKQEPLPDEFEMYNVTEDPIEIMNLYNDGIHTSQQNTMAQLLQQQCAEKRLTPCSGDVPGQLTCGQAGCST